jgi:tetrahydromethanopterin S-methyltransferase subunit G
MFEENEVLTQIRALRQEVGSRLDDMDQRLRKIEAELSSPAMQGFGSRLEEVDRRLQRLESELANPVANAVIQNGSFTPEPQVQQVQQQAPAVPTHPVEITISPLYDVAHVSVVEAALRSIVGVESVTLQSLKGDGAEVAVEVQEGVSLIGGLRRTLPVAFDVADADNTSFTLGLVQPAVETRDDAVVQKAL